MVAATTVTRQHQAIEKPGRKISTGKQEGYFRGRRHQVATRVIAGKKGSMQLPEVGTITLDELEIQMIKKALEFHKNEISKAATALGITRSSLYRRLEKYNIPYDETAD